MNKGGNLARYPLRLCIGITGNDKPGIIAQVTAICFRFGGNLEDASMTVLSGEFAMIVIASFRRGTRLDHFTSALHALEIKQKLSITVKEVAAKKDSRTEAGSSIVPHLVTIFGKDKAGIIYHVSSLFAKYGLNITDLNSKLMHSPKRSIYGVLLEVDIPKRFPLAKLKKSLSRIARTLNVDLTLKQVEPVTL